LAIPTTAGSGAEVTENAVIYINSVKYSVEGKYIKPNTYMLIPEFTKNASNSLKASAGFDSIAQSMESLISIKSNKTSVMYASNSLDLSLKYFPKFLKNPNTQNTYLMLKAANLSGKAISISKTTAPHAVSYPFSSKFNINHGHAVLLTLGKFLKFNFENINHSKSNFNLKDRFKIIFEKTKSKNINEFTNYLNALSKISNLETDFKNLGINIKKTLPYILENVSDQRLKNNPIDLDTEAIRKILLNS
jgi:alcohol dehydrogenase class IV